jgi:hypothetical protein
VHASICRYAGSRLGTDEVTRAARQLMAALSGAPGFVSYALLDMGGDELTSFSVFETRSELEAGELIIAGWMLEHLPTLRPARSPGEVGEIILQRGM